MIVKNTPETPEDKVKKTDEPVKSQRDFKIGTCTAVKLLGRMNANCMRTS